MEFFTRVLDGQEVLIYKFLNLGRFDIPPLIPPLLMGVKKQKKLADIRMRRWCNGVVKIPLNKGEAEGRGIMNEVDIKRKELIFTGRYLHYNRNNHVIFLSVCSAYSAVNK